MVVLGVEGSEGSVSTPSWKILKKRDQGNNVSGMSIRPRPMTQPTSRNPGGFILDNPLAAVSSAMLAAGSVASGRASASFVPKARPQRFIEGEDGKHHGKKMARDLANAPDGSRVQLLLQRSSGTHLISLALGRSSGSKRGTGVADIGLGMRLHIDSASGETRIQNLAQDGPAMSAGHFSYRALLLVTLLTATLTCAGRALCSGVLEGDRLLAISIEEAPPTTRSQYLDKDASPRVLDNNLCLL